MAETIISKFENEINDKHIINIVDPTFNLEIIYSIKFANFLYI